MNRYFLTLGSVAVLLGAMACELHACDQRPYAIMSPTTAVFIPPLQQQAFSDSGSYDPDDGDPGSPEAEAAIVGWEWWVAPEPFDEEDWRLFDDSGPSTTQTFRFAGHYRVALDVWDNDDAYSWPYQGDYCEVYVVSVDEIQ